MCGAQCGCVARNLVLLKHKDLFYNVSAIYKSSGFRILLAVAIISFLDLLGFTGVPLSRNTILYLQLILLNKEFFSRDRGAAFRSGWLVACLNASKKVDLLKMALKAKPLNRFGYTHQSPNTQILKLALSEAPSSNCKSQHATSLEYAAEPSLRESGGRNSQAKRVKKISYTLGSIICRKTLKSGCLSLLTIRSFGARDGLGLSVRVWLGFGLGGSVRAIDSLSDAV
eukprot:sb/3469577/